MNFTLSRVSPISVPILLIVACNDPTSFEPPAPPQPLASGGHPAIASQAGAAGVHPSGGQPSTAAPAPWARKVDTASGGASGSSAQPSSVSDLNAPPTDLPQTTEPEPISAGSAGLPGADVVAGAAGAGGTTASGPAESGGSNAAGGDPNAAAGNDGTAAIEPASLWFSEYVEGSGQKKALEISTGAANNLDSCRVVVYANGSAKPSRSLSLSGALEPGAPFVLCTPELASQVPCDQQASLTFNGNDAVLLECGDQVIDAIGQLGVDPGEHGWGSGDLRTFDMTLRRSCATAARDPDPDDPFDPAQQWTAAGLDVVDGLGVDCSRASDAKH